MLAAGVLAAGCSNDSPDDAASPEGRAGAEQPDATFDARLQVEGDSVHVSYRFTNEADEPLLVVNRLPTDVGAGVEYRAEAAYVVGLSDELVEISQRVFAKPEGVEYESLPKVGVTEVPPGETVTTAVVVPLPLALTGPWGEDPGPGAVDVPDDPAEVEFCLGVLTPPYDERLTTTDDGQRVTFHGSVERQALFCSDPVTLG